MVLIDAAKGCATEPPDLSKYPADFVVISFYKVSWHFFWIFMKPVFYALLNILINYFFIFL